MTIDEILYRHEGIILGVELAISKVDGMSLSGSKECVLAVLRALLEAEHAAYRTTLKVNNYDPTARTERGH